MDKEWDYNKAKLCTSGYVCPSRGKLVVYNTCNTDWGNYFKINNITMVENNPFSYVLNVNEGDKLTFLFSRGKAIFIPYKE